MIDEKDLRIQVYRGHLGWGLYGSTKPLVVITHIPTGIEVKSDEKASALENKALCLSELEARLNE